MRAATARKAAAARAEAGRALGRTSAQGRAGRGALSVAGTGRDQLDAGLEPADVPVHRDAALADRGLEVGRGHRQRSRWPRGRRAAAR